MTTRKIHWSVRRAVLALAVAAAFVVPVSSCRGSAGSPKLLFLAVDALDWEMVDQLSAEGRLPNLTALMARGCAARVDTNEPDGDSALYWTTIATGQFASKHGINGFVAKDPETGQLIPNTSNRRRTKAFWNIASDKGLSVGVVGWFVTWPAETVRGFMVSAYMGYKKDQPVQKGTFFSGDPDMVYPSSLLKKTEPLVRRAQAKLARDFTRIMPPTGRVQRKIRKLRAEWAFLSDLIYYEIGLEFYREKKPRLFAVYLSGIDVAGHRFTRARAKAQDNVKSRYGDVHSNYYIYTDEMLGPFLEAADEQTVIIVASDHGLMRGEHTTNGVFVIAGPGIRRNARLRADVRLTDICPTLLYLLGIPVAQDMDGRVCREAVEESFLARHPISYVPTYGRRKEFSDQPKKSEFDTAIIERLKSLGYLK